MSGEGGRAASDRPSEWFDGARRVLFVHAHPDDETITTGGTLAALADAGREPALVTLTRGERGEVRPGPLQHLAGSAGLAAQREAELAAALAQLGGIRHAFLGSPPALAGSRCSRTYSDSGMRWGPDGRARASEDAPPTALTRVAVVEPLDDLLALAWAWMPEAIVSYDAAGGYGHPDHVFAHRAARAVALALERPFWQIVVPGPAGGTPEDAGGAPEPHDVTAWLDRKRSALRCHASQLQLIGDQIVHVGGQREAVGAIECVRRVRAP